MSPVTAQLYSGPNANKTEKTRTLYLPKGSWYNFRTGKKEEGGKLLTVPAPINLLPLYVKAGSIIPMGGEMEYATQKPATSIELRIYPGADGSFALYEDENDTYNYEKGASATISFLWSDKSRTLTVSGRKGTFPGMLQNRTFNAVLVKEGRGTGEPAATNSDKTISYNGKAVTVRFE